MGGPPWEPRTIPPMGVSVVPTGLGSLFARLTQDLRPGLSYVAPPGLALLLSLRDLFQVLSDCYRGAEAPLFHVTACGRLARGPDRLRQRALPGWSNRDRESDSVGSCPWVGRLARWAG
jgi:hypothetical protein